MVKEVIRSGADAVYVGALGLSRRHPKYELTHQKIKKAAALAVKSGTKIIVAWNLDIETSLLPFLYRKAEDYCAWGIDSIILKSRNIMKALHERFPDLKIYASVGCNIHTYKEMLSYNKYASYVTMSTLICKKEEVRRYVRDAHRAGFQAEALIHGNRCIDGVGGCKIYDHFRTAFKKIATRDTDGMKRNKVFGNPDKGGICFRPCLGTNIRSIREKLDPQEIRKIKQAGNPAFTFSENEVRDYIDAGIDILKVQGREYPVDLISKLIRAYRNVIDRACSPQNEAIASLELRRNKERTKKTALLHSALLKSLN